MINDKAELYDFWNDASCGEELYLKGQDKHAFDEQALKRYELEPYIEDFAEFELSQNLNIRDRRGFGSRSSKIC